MPKIFQAISAGRGTLRSWQAVVRVRSLHVKHTGSCGVLTLGAAAKFLFTATAIAENMGNLDKCCQVEIVLTVGGAMSWLENILCCLMSQYRWRLY
jgi:hypothetical protein